MTTTSPILRSLLLLPALLLLLPAFPPAVHAGDELTGLSAAEIRAQVRSRERTVLSSELPARIWRLTVREGESFTRNQELVRFHCTPFQAELRQAQAAAQGSKAQLQAVERLHALKSSGDLELEVAQARHEESLALVALKKSQVANCVIRAPFDGRVAELNVSAHQFTDVGTPLMTIIDHLNLEVALIVPSHWLLWLKPGTPFQVHLGETGQAYPAEVVRWGAEVDPVSQSIQVVGRIPGAHPELFPGMSGQVTFPRGNGPGSLPEDGDSAP